MSELKILSIEDIIAENQRLTGNRCDPKRRKDVEGCYSSFFYYDTPQEQITSIVVSLIKGHFFVDGNKRTALSTYIVLSQVNGIKYIETTDEQVNVFVDIAVSKKSIAEYVKMLFPMYKLMLM